MESRPREELLDRDFNTSAQFKKDIEKDYAEPRHQSGADGSRGWSSSRDCENVMAASKFEPQGVIPACLLPFHRRPQHRRDILPQAPAGRRRRRAGSRRSPSTRTRPKSLRARSRSSSASSRSRWTRWAARDPGRARRVRRRQPGGGAHRAHGASAAASSCLLVFPPNPLGAGLALPPRDGRSRISRRSRMLRVFPIICFQYPLAGGLGYPVETLVKLLDAVPTVRAIKDWCNSPMQHERQIRLLQARRPVRSTSCRRTARGCSPSLVLGCNGLPVGLRQRDRGPAGGTLPRR